MGKSVCTLSLPVTREPHSGRLFLESMEECMEILEKHFHKKLTARRLEKGRRLVLRAADESKRFFRIFRCGQSSLHS